MTPEQVFEDEIALIENGCVKRLVCDVLDYVGRANPYFFKAQASSTGKYHPVCCNVRSGLIRHVKRAVYIGAHLSRGMKFSQLQTDVVVAALIVHDIWKNDYAHHASRASNTIVQVVHDNPDRYSALGPGPLAGIARCVLYHMGPWTEKKFRKEMRRYTQEEIVVYMSDYIASRRGIDIDATDEFPLENLEDLKVEPATAGFLLASA